MALVFNNEDIVANFPPVLQRNFQELLRYGKIGLCPFSWNDIAFVKSCTEDNSTYYYYYTLKVPFAGHRLSWDLIFTPEDMSFAPNFNFNDESFYLSQDLDIVIQNIPSLVTWNVNNSKALVSVLKEFLALYKKQQIENLQKENIYSHIFAEYQRLMNEVAANDVELFLGSTSASIMINIKVDFSCLPEYVQELKEVLSNPGEDNCLLKISYVKLDGSKVNTTVQLSPRLKQALDTVHIPLFAKETPLSVYVDSVKKSLQDHIKSIEQHYKLKKQFINCLCVKYGHCVIEFDAETFTRGVLLREVDGYFCIIHIDIGTNFPKECPTVTVQSLYCNSFAQICTQTIDGYPYSPRWAPENMLQRLMTHLAEDLPKFRNHKH